MLSELGLMVGNRTKVGEIFENLFPDIFAVQYNKPSEYVQSCWEAYIASGNSNNNLNGKMFELILATLCIRENIIPIYMQAKVAFVPNVDYDLMFYSAERGPICWSAKTSLRERYKQADLESIALKYVHRRALSYLITLNETEAINVKKKIKSGDVIGLDDVTVATNKAFDALVEDLKKFKFERPPTVKVIESSCIVTQYKVEKLRST